MLIKIIRVQENTLTHTVTVSFVYDLARKSPSLSVNIFPSEVLIGTWIGKTPQKDKWYDVEITIDNLIWGLNVSVINHSKSLITKSNDGEIILQGHLQIFEDGIGTLQIESSLLTCNLVGISEPIDTFVRINTDQIMIYDTDTLRY